MLRNAIFCSGILASLAIGIAEAQETASAGSTLKAEATEAMKRAAAYYYNNVATHGGYVYHYSLDLKERWGEGRATPDQIWVQPPGTPTVGMAYLKAYQATDDAFFLQAAVDAARALAYGQLESGGWTNCIDFNPRGERSAKYRNGRGNGKNYSSLDDGQTQAALQFMIATDKALGLKADDIHQSAIIGLDALLAAQFPNGGFPQVWDGPVEARPVKPARYPDHDWRTEGRVKAYWEMYTLNDNVTGYVARTLIEADRAYDDPRPKKALRKLGDFLLLAQMPEPQPGWAQQYNQEMQPIWARKFEPPGVSGDETQEVIETLLTIHTVTGDRKYLQPIPSALDWLERSQLPDGRLARYYELKTNRPLYMTRRGDTYSLTHDDSNLPSHYGWKTASRIDLLRDQYKRHSAAGASVAMTKEGIPTREELESILDQLDDQGRWVSVYGGERLIGQAKMTPGSPYLASAVFSQNLSRLANYVLNVERADSTSQSRTWHDRTGKFSIEAELIQVQDAIAKLRRADGKIVTVPIDQLSDADQQILKSTSADAHR
ncbi:pectate lyase [Roseiconus nitratireducens]|nr:pectate lyase [Roseiconus nitratireducens]